MTRPEKVTGKLVHCATQANAPPEWRGAKDAGIHTNRTHHPASTPGRLILPQFDSLEGAGGSSYVNGYTPVLTQVNPRKMMEGLSSERNVKGFVKFFCLIVHLKALSVRGNAGRLSGRRFSVKNTGYRSPGAGHWSHSSP